MAQVAPAPAETADEARHVDDIVVTARRRAESIQDVPVAITAVSNESLRVQNVQQFSDLGRVVAGFSSSTGTRGSYSPAFAIRGQRGPYTQSLLLDPAVSVYFAEFNLSRTVGANQGMFDLESVQVLKGPQGTLFGRNATGGAVLIEPKKPTFDFEGYGQVSAGSYDLRDFEGVVNVPFGDKVALRVGGKITKRDGYLHSLAGQDLDDLDAQSGRASLTFKPSDEFESTFIGTYFKGKGNGHGLRIFAVDPRGVASPALRPFLNTLASADLAATMAGPKYFTRTNQPQSVYDRSRSIQNNTTINLGATALGELTAKNIVGYRDVKDVYDGLGVNGSSVDIFRNFNTSIEGSQWSEEFQFQGDSKRFDWVVGGYYFRESGSDKFDTAVFPFVTSPAFAALAGPTLTAALLRALPSFNHADVDVVNESYAFFAHANYKITDSLTIAGGVRLTHDSREATYHNQTYAGTTPAPTVFTCAATGVRLSTIDPTLCSVKATQGQSVLTYDLSLDYRLNSDVLLYAVTRRGYRSGGFNNSPPGAGTLDGAAFKPEFNRDVELGVKADFNMGDVAGRLNAAGFYQWYTDVQRTVAFVNPVTGVAQGRTLNAAKARIYGGEVELTLKPTETLTFAANGSIFGTKYDDWHDSLNVAALTTTPAIPQIQAVDVSDSKFQLVPYRQFNISATYSPPVPESWGVPSLTATWVGQSGQQTQEPDTKNCGTYPTVNPLNPARAGTPLTPADLTPAGAPAFYTGCLNSIGRIPGYSLVNVRADWRNIAGTGLDVAVFVNNLAKKYYYTHAVTSVTGLGYASAGIGAPRMFGVEVRFPFGAMGY